MRRARRGSLCTLLRHDGHASPRADVGTKKLAVMPQHSCVPEWALPDHVSRPGHHFSQAIDLVTNCHYDDSEVCEGVRRNREAAARRLYLAVVCALAY